MHLLAISSCSTWYICLSSYTPLGRKIHVPPYESLGASRKSIGTAYAIIFLDTLEVSCAPHPEKQAEY
jgi:hypothetical protein